MAGPSSAQRARTRRARRRPSVARGPSVAAASLPTPRHGGAAPPRALRVRGAAARPAAARRARGQRVEDEGVAVVAAAAGADVDLGQAQQPVQDRRGHVDGAHAVGGGDHRAAVEQAGAQLDLRRRDPVAGGEPPGDAEGDDERPPRAGPTRARSPVVRPAMSRPAMAGMNRPTSRTGWMSSIRALSRRHSSCGGRLTSRRPRRPRSRW